MGKTNAPHSESFLAFATWTLEQVVALRHEMPWFISPEDFASFSEAELSGPMRRSQARRHDVVVSALTRLEQERMVAAGYSPASLREAPARRFLATTVSRMIVTQALRYDDQPTRFDKNADGSFKPLRSTVVDVIIGQLITRGGHDFLATANLLNRGVPASHRRDRVSGSEIRNAVDTFHMRRFKSQNHLLHYGSLLASQARALDRLWGELPASSNKPGLRRFEIVQNLAADGGFFELYEKYLLEEPVPPRPGEELLPLLRKSGERASRSPRRSAM